MAAQVSKPRVESFEGRRTAAPSYRLPPDHVATLKSIFVEAEGDAGMKTVWYSGPDDWTSGTGGNDPEPIHMFDAETWCDRQHVFSDRGRAAKNRRAREALLDMIEAGHSDLVTVLHRMYGPKDPNARHDLFGELATVIGMTEAVERVGEEIEADRKDVARARFDAFWAGREDGSKARRIAVDRVVSDCKTDPGVAMRYALDARVEDRPGESRASHAERQIQRNGERVAFTALAMKQADALVAAACRTYFLTLESA